MSTAIVLAGGKSSRMGSPKALLLFDGTPLIMHVVATLRSLFEDVAIVAAPEQELPSIDATIVRDDVAFQGPVGGIYYGLRAAGGEINFVTSCDSVFLNAGLISHLLAQIPEYDVVVPHWEGRFQPLHAVYRATVLPHLEVQLARGELRPIFLFDKVRTRRVDEDEIRRFDPDGASFFNMNTPDDYAEALKRWSARAAEGASLASIHCTVELLGVAQLVAKTREVSVALPPHGTFRHLYAALAEALPALVGRVIRADRSGLVEGCACSVNGLRFVRSASEPVRAGDSILILPADAGG